MAEFPALPLWTDAYLADTIDLTDAEHGIYLLLLIISWRRPKCDLPPDMKWLQRVLNAYCGGKLHGNRFRALVPPLLARFFDCDSEGNFVQKRLRKERDFVEKRSRSQSEIAKKRWAAESNSKDLADAAAVPPGNAPTPTPTPIKKEERINTANGYGNGKHDPDTTTIKNPYLRIQKFMQSLVPRLGKEPWIVIASACDPASPAHLASLQACKTAARTLGKGWPRNWPASPDFFEQCVKPELQTLRD